MMPSCPDASISYDISLSNGAPLPSYIVANLDTSTITVVDDGTLKIGTVTIRVIGSNENIDATFLIKVNIQEN